MVNYVIICYCVRFVGHILIELLLGWFSVKMRNPPICKAMKFVLDKFPFYNYMFDYCTYKMLTTLYTLTDIILMYFNTSYDGSLYTDTL